MAKNKICWITPDYFADCDIPYVPYLLKDFDIHWVVLLPNQSRYSEGDFLDLSKQADNLSVEIIRSKRRERNPLKVFEYLKINKIIKRECPVLVYINMAVSSPWQIPMFLKLPKDKTIITAHQGRVHEGMGHYRYNNFLRDIVYGRLKNVNMFSKSQANFFKERYKDSKVFQFPLGLKEFGQPTIGRKDDCLVRFLSFGTINYAKHIDLLIDAANLVYEKGYKNIKIIVKGGCSNWDFYLDHIKYRDIVEADIRMIDNSEIPNLFTNADYFVQPYRVVSQSGPFKIALNYNLPLITSNLPGFTDEMVDGTTGFTFKCNDVGSLADTMIQAVELKNNTDSYVGLKKRMQEYVSENYSSEVLVGKYTDMFNVIINKK